MELLQTLIWFLVAIIVLVTFHEWGHFYVARLCGVKVLRFSVGFGNPLWSWTDKKGTEFAVAAIPLGGYVKMVDEREGEVKAEDLPYAFNRKNVWQRIAVVAAGPAANLLLAVIFFWILFLPGRADLAPIIGEIQPGSIAERARLEVGQEIVAVDGVYTPTQRDVLSELINHMGESGPLSFSVKYPDSDRIYTSDAMLDAWLKDSMDPNPIAELGITFEKPPVVVGLIEDGPGKEAGFKEGDRVLSADGVNLSDWSGWAEYVSARPGQSIDVVVKRAGDLVNLTVMPVEEVVEGKTVGRVRLGGMYDQSYVRRYEYSVGEAFVAGVEETMRTVSFVFVSVKKLILGEISHKNLSGPLTIAKVAGSSAASGWMSFLGFLALLSVSLGVFNLLPIPVLDGGHLMYYLVEAIKGSPVSEKVQVIGYQLGLFLVVSLMVLAIYNDVLRL
ncbi:sigma E protease regulator RseP [Aurantivibrio plasticivorans]